MENEKDMMGSNIVLGKGPKTIEDRVVPKIDSETAKREAFGENFSEDERREMEFEYFRNAIEMVKERGDKAKATTIFSKKLKDQISEMMNMDRGGVEIYNANGTPLDTFHKISAFVEIESERVRGGKVFISLDIYTDEDNKRDKADVVFRKPDCGFSPESEDNEEYLETLKRVAEEIVAKAQKFIDKKKAEQQVVPGMKTGNKRVVRFDKRGSGKGKFMQ